MYSIGEFSRITGLSIKALRLYHEKELLIPSVVDKGSNYRYYDHNNVEQARIITHLRSMEFSLEDIGDMLSETDDDTDIEACMQVRKGKTAEGISVRELPGGRCVSLIHKGAYDTHVLNEKM